VPSGPGNGIDSPRQRRFTTSRSRNIVSFACALFSGASTKSSGFQPDAKEIATRPDERLSTSAHSSATRIGWWSGRTTLPERSFSRSVTSDSAPAKTDGLG